VKINDFGRSQIMVCFLNPCFYFLKLLVHKVLWNF
jgi:hypothetical protein